MTAELACTATPRRPTLAQFAAYFKTLTWLDVAAYLSTRVELARADAFHFEAQYTAYTLARGPAKRGTITPAIFFRPLNCDVWRERLPYLADGCTDPRADTEEALRHMGMRWVYGSSQPTVAHLRAVRILCPPLYEYIQRRAHALAFHQAAARQKAPMMGCALMLQLLTPPPSPPLSEGCVKFCLEREYEPTINEYPREHYTKQSGSWDVGDVTPAMEGEPRDDELWALHMVPWDEAGGEST
ncbi:hypothetical protein Q8F55_001653 [Vanrija albida]|uniref:Uncharacterized protein n=1 Tax=Vanrija albida TaxID=181172 RepID=A0ABR3Q7J9_9TREE